MWWKIFLTHSYFLLSKLVELIMIKVLVRGGAMLKQHVLFMSMGDYNMIFHKKQPCYNF
jgi:hypothetical protein